MTDAARAMRRQLLAGSAAVLLIGGTATAWSTMMEIESAVVATGTVVVETNVKKVQHPAGGVIGRIDVREGQRVRKDHVVARLDDTQTRATLGIVLNELSAQRLRFARLSAEREGRKSFEVPADLVQRAAGEPELAKVIDGEVKLMASRVKTREGQNAQLGERVAQSRQEIRTLEEQLKSLQRQLRIGSEELKGLKPLYDRFLVPKNRYSTIEREVARNEGAIAEVRAKLVQAKGKVNELELQLAQLEKDALTEINKELREAETRIGEQNQRRIAAEDQLTRVDIRAPIDGVVHQLNVHTVGGVINNSEPLMLIVPDADRLVVEIRIPPQDIDNLQRGMDARVRFSAFSSRTTPEVPGKLTRISADALRDPQTGQLYYLGAVTVAEADLQASPRLKLLPGMPAEVFLRTGQRTPISFLTKPFRDNMERMLREE